uniref:DUF541 domain-containing protein n=1 Tax=Panagrolaimus superbus TaxID=310955 RepID=A0A914Y6F5_9BILA
MCRPAALKVRDIAKLGKVLDALAAQGANQINGPSFEIDQPEPVYDEARLAALKKAQARAQTYAKSLGLQVRRIVSISENSNGGFRPMQMMRTMSAGAAMDKATPVAPGESTVSVNPGRGVRTGPLIASATLNEGGSRRGPAFLHAHRRRWLKASPTIMPLPLGSSRHAALLMDCQPRAATRHGPWCVEDFVTGMEVDHGSYVSRCIPALRPRPRSRLERGDRPAPAGLPVVAHPCDLPGRTDSA